MILFVFLILGLLNAVEATTTISRRAGYSINNPASGLIFQSSLSLLSRALIFMFMPILGSLADANNLLSTESDVLLYFLFTPIFLTAIYFSRFKLEGVFGQLLMNINDFGTYFKKSKKTYKLNLVTSNVKRKKSLSFYVLVLVAYVPYYLSWPLIIILLDKFNESRGLILGLSSLFNGLNTIIITVWIDPRLAKLGMYKNIILRTYSDLLFVRIFSAILSFIVLFIVIKFL
jgi:hypothetical protein